MYGTLAPFNPPANSEALLSLAFESLAQISIRERVVSK